MLATCASRVAAPCGVRAANPLIRVSPIARQPAFRRRATVVSRAANGAAAEGEGPYEGEFGTWYVTQADKLEVWSYRASLSLVAAAFGAGTLAALAPDADWAAALQHNGNALAAAGGLGMAAATALIHIYITPLKRFLQVLVGVGAAGAAYLAATHPDVQLPAYVAANPGAIWLVGPGFAALTGIAFKEGFCYGKGEAWALSLLLPALLLAHLSGLPPAPLEQGASAVVAALLAVFAARKWTQGIKEDIGDKSVFEFYAMTDDQKRERLEQLRMQVAQYTQEELAEMRRVAMEELKKMADEGRL